MLAPMMEAEVVGPALRLGLRSAALYAELATELRSEHALEIGYRVTGLLRVALSSETREQQALEHHAAQLMRSGLPDAARVALLDGDEARRREPDLSPDVCAALEMPGEGQVDPRLLLPALSAAAERAGVRFVSDCVVREILTTGGRACGVRLDAESVYAEHVVVAAGSWTSLVPGIPLPSVTIAPVKGQMLRTHARPRLLSRIVFGAGGCLVPRASGDVLVGATTEHVGFTRGVTLSGLAELIAIATRITPRLATSTVLEHWAGFRPGTPDGLPLVGATSVTNLWLASGHYRNGILLAPITAELLCAHLRGESLGELHADAKAFDPRRFARPESATQAGADHE
jgi:glycine oxidase